MRALLARLILVAALGFGLSAFAEDSLAGVEGPFAVENRRPGMACNLPLTGYACNHGSR